MGWRFSRTGWLLACVEGGDPPRQYKSEQVPTIDIKSNTITAQDSRTDPKTRSLARITQPSTRRDLKFIHDHHHQKLTVVFESQCYHLFVLFVLLPRTQFLKMCMAKEKLVTKSGSSNGVAGNGKSESAKRNWTTMFTKVIKQNTKNGTTTLCMLFI